MPSDEACAKCGTPLMLIVTPPSVRNEVVWSDVFSQEHLLERISLLELRLMQVTDRLSQALELILKQSRTVQNEHLLIESLLETLTNSGVIKGDHVSQIWQDKKKQEEKQAALSERRQVSQEKILAGTNSTKFDLFTNLVKEGFQLIEQGEEKQGLRTLERAVAIEPRNFHLVAFISEHYFRTDKRVLARDYLERAHKIAPLEFKNALLLGITLADDNEIEAAKKMLEPLVNDFSFVSNFILGIIYAAEKNFAETLTAFKKTLAARPCAETHYLVGSTYAELNRQRMAIRHLQKAVEIDSNFGDAWFTLGAVFLREGDEKSAKEALSMALAARDVGAQSHAILRNPQKYGEITTTSLLFARLQHIKKNLVNGLTPRLSKVLREEIEKVLN